MTSILLAALLGQLLIPEGAVIGSNSGDYPGTVVRGGGVYLDGQYAYLQSGGGRTLYMRDSVPAGSASPSFMWQSLNFRTSGSMLLVYNQNALVMSLGVDGSLTLHGDGAFTTSGAHSGSYSLLSGVNAYLAIAGQHAPSYWGHHGAVQVANKTRMTAGFPFEVYNARSDTGLASDHIFFVNYLGGLETQANIRSFELPVCDGHDVNPESDNSNRYTGVIPDGGHDWYTATDAGHAMDGCVMLWVTDVRSACQCDSLLYDGGLTSSWYKLHDRSECKP